MENGKKQMSLDWRVEGQGVDVQTDITVEIVHVLMVIVTHTQLRARDTITSLLHVLSRCINHAITERKNASSELGLRPLM